MNNLTIVAVDTAYHALTSRAIEQAVKVTNSKNVLVLSDQNIYPGSDLVKIDPITQPEYSKIVLKDLAPYIKTDHFMVIQYDGMPIDAEQWNPEYLNYDYIGAAWPWGPENRRVGNGGFSIRSRKLAEACTDDQVVFNPPGYGDNNYMEDTHICHMYRDFLESKGITYATVPLAKQFSAELPGGRYPTFGFHGTLCLPYYLDDDHMEFYIDNMTARMFTSDTQTRIAFGLYLAERYELLEHMMDRGTSLNPNLKDTLIKQVPQEQHYFPGLTVEEIEQLLVNYS